MKLKAIFFALRPKTLSAAILPVIAVAAYVYPANLSLCIFAALSALCIQIASNLFNDAIDFKKGADTIDRLGPKRATQMQWLSAKQVMSLACAFCLLAAIIAIPLILQVGTPMVLLGGLCICLAYLYTGGPYPLAYYGLGDVFVFLFFGLAACLGTYYLYDTNFNLDIFILAIQCGLLCTTLIVINNLRDIDGDKKVNKRTLAVIMGKTFCRFELLFLYVSAFALQFYWLYIYADYSFALPLVFSILAYKLVRLIFSEEPSQKYNTYLAKASMIYVGFILLQSIGFLCR